MALRGNVHTVVAIMALRGIVCTVVAVMALRGNVCTVRVNGTDRLRPTHYAGMPQDSHKFANETNIWAKIGFKNTHVD